MSEILQGAEPFYYKGSPKGVLLLHGFTGTPQSLRGLAEELKTEGYSVNLPLLPGHGTKKEDMLGLVYADWYEASEKALEQLKNSCEKVAVGGLSMGGTLAINLLINHPEISCGFVVNPLIEPPDESVMTLLRSLEAAGEKFTLAVGSDIKKEGVSELCYDATPVKEVLSLIESAAKLKKDISKITAPVLILVSTEDHVVNNESSKKLAELLGDLARVCYLENSFHVATLDNDAPLIKDEVLKHLRSWL